MNEVGLEEEKVAGANGRGNGRGRGRGEDHNEIEHHLGPLVSTL